MADLNEDKLRELVLYICSKTSPEELGATKLNKILWYSDVNNYLRTGGKSITGETYVKRQFGPVPLHVLIAIDDLKGAGRLATREATCYGYPKREFFALGEPNLELFTADEINIIDRCIDIICFGHTATSISELTHDRIWELAEIGEEIPYYAILASSIGEVDEEDVEWAKEILEEAV